MQRSQWWCAEHRMCTLGWARVARGSGGSTLGLHREERENERAAGEHRERLHDRAPQRLLNPHLEKVGNHIHQPKLDQIRSRVDRALRALHRLVAHLQQHMRAEHGSRRWHVHRVLHPIRDLSAARARVCAPLLWPTSPGGSPESVSPLNASSCGRIGRTVAACCSRRALPSRSSEALDAAPPQVSGSAHR